MARSLARVAGLVVFAMALICQLSLPAGADDLATVDSVVVQKVAVDADGGTDVSHDGEAHAEGEHAGEDHTSTPLLSFDTGSAIWNLVIFLCVLAILSKFVWPGVLGGLQAREEKIREDLEGAEKANADAKALLAAYDVKLKDASVQVQTMLADARKDAAVAGQKILDEAKADAAAQRERALADIESAKKVALAEMAGQTSNLAMQVARGVVGRELSADDHADLIRQAMQRIPSSN